MSFTKIKLEDSPTAEECRAILGDLPTAKEKRKGKMWYIFIYIILINGGGLTFLFSLDSHLMNEILFGIIWFSVFITMFFFTGLKISYESKLSNQNKFSELINFIQPNLRKGENILAVVVGITFDNTKKSIYADWIPTDINRYSYFIFTTDRLIIITFKTHLKTTDNIVDSLTTNTFEDNIQHVYTCSLADKTNVKYGGLVPHPLAVFTWTAIRVTPVKQNGMHTWFLEDKHTANGKMIKTIFKRLSDKRDF